MCCFYKPSYPLSPGVFSSYSVTYTDILPMLECMLIVINKAKASRNRVPVWKLPVPKVKSSLSIDLEQKLCGADVHEEVDPKCLHRMKHGWMPGAQRDASIPLASLPWQLTEEGGEKYGGAFPGSLNTSKGGLNATAK